MTEIEEARTERSAHYRAIFANAFRLRASNNDIALTLAIDTLGPDGKRVFVDEAQLFMTPGAVKILVQLLQTTIAAHEREHGPIVLAPGKLESIEKSIKTTKAT